MLWLRFKCALSLFFFLLRLCGACCCSSLSRVLVLCVVRAVGIWRAVCVGAFSASGVCRVFFPYTFMFSARVSLSRLIPPAFSRPPVAKRRELRTHKSVKKDVDAQREATWASHNRTMRRGRPISAGHPKVHYPVQRRGVLAMNGRYCADIPHVRGARGGHHVLVLLLWPIITTLHSPRGNDTPTFFLWALS